MQAVAEYFTFSEHEEPNSNFIPNCVKFEVTPKRARDHIRSPTDLSNKDKIYYGTDMHTILA